MLQPATLGLCVSLLADLFPVGSGTRIDLAAGARAEVNVGRIPVTSIRDSELGTEETVVLRSGIRLISPTSTLTLAYRPIYYLRLPDVLGVGRPLLLHDATLGWAARLDRHVSLNWDTRSAIGEVPNSGLAMVFNPGTGRVQASVIPIVQLSTSLAMLARTGKRHTTNATVGANHYDAWGGGNEIHQSDNITAAFSHSIALSERTSVGFATNAGYAVAETVASSATVGARLTLSQRTGDAGTLRGAAGLSYGWFDADDGRVSWPLPTIDVGYTTRLVATGQTWDTSVSAGTRAFFDAASAVYRPQLYLAASVSGKILNTWTISPSMTFSTDISGVDLPSGQQPTQFNLTVPFAYRIAQNFDFAFGLRLGLSAPALPDWGTGDFQDQISVFIALDWGTGTEKSRGSWL